MSADSVLYWVAAGLVAIGLVLSFTHWWHPSLFFLALGAAVCALSALVSGRWPTDYIVAAIAALYGLVIIYVAYRKEREEHARTEEHEGQEHGVLPEGSGGAAQQRRLPLGLRRPGRQRRTGSDQPPRPL